MISFTDFRKQLSEIVSNMKTKIIVKNNEPVAVLVPYSEYIALSEGNEGYQKMLNEKEKEQQKMLKGIGQDITMNNGVQIMVVVEKGTTGLDEGNIITKTFIKMKTSGDYKLYHEHHLSSPIDDANLTNEERYEYYRKSRSEKEEQ